MRASVRKAAFPRTGLLAGGAVLAMLLVAPYAGATTIRIHFSGAAGSGYADLTVAPDPDSSSSYDVAYQNPNPTLSSYDPAGARHITGASGRFNGETIVGVVPTSPGTPPGLNADDSGPPYENLPKSFSWLNPSLTPPANSYDNLYYANGSPLVCPPRPPQPYTFHGGFLDIFGVMFALGNNNVLALWSDGVVPPGFSGTDGGLQYGLALLEPNGDGYVPISSQFAGATASVPEPNRLWLFGAGLFVLFAWRRSVEARKRNGFGAKR